MWGFLNLHVLIVGIRMIDLFSLSYNNTKIQRGFRVTLARFRDTLFLGNLE